MTGPLHRPIDVRALSRTGHREMIEASAKERAALARANDLVSVARFSAELVAMPWGDDGVRLSGRVTAEVVQSCVVTLDPVPARLDEPFDATFVPEGSPLVRDPTEGEILIDAEAEDAPETFAPPMLDAGAVVAEFFTLGLDPYPRAPDAELPPGASDERVSPFAALAALKGQ